MMKLMTMMTGAPNEGGPFSTRSSSIAGLTWMSRRVVKRLETGVILARLIVDKITELKCLKQLDFLKNIYFDELRSQV